MPVYDYTALDIRGKTTSGIIDAESAPAARQKLRSSSIFPVSVEEVQETTSKDDSPTFSVRNVFSRVKRSEISMFTRQLATLVGAGFPLVSAIDALIPQTKSNGLKRTLSQIKDSIVEGKSFADALSPYPDIFSSLYSNMIHAAETSGTLEIVLDKLADITEKQQALKNRIQSALAYPIFMTLLGTVVLFFLLTYVIPSVTSIFSDMNQVLPAPTRFLITISDSLKAYWWIILITIAGAAVAFRSVRKMTRGRYFIDKTILSLPVIGLLVKKLAAARFSRTLGSLLENGVPMLSALEIVKNIAGNIVISDTIEDAAKEVEKGQGLGTALAEGKILPDLSIQMIQVGEQSGKLEAMLNKVADVFENEVESSIAAMTSLVEPVMLLIMGAIVMFIVLSILLPIFEMNQLVM